MTQTEKHELIARELDGLYQNGLGQWMERNRDIVTLISLPNFTDQWHKVVENIGTRRDVISITLIKQITGRWAVKILYEEIRPHEAYPRKQEILRLSKELGEAVVNATVEYLQKGGGK